MKSPFLKPTAISLVLSALAFGAPLAHAAATDRLANIKTKGTADITARTTSLTALTTKIGNAKRLTTDQKNALTTEIKDESTSITALGTTLSAETTTQQR